MEFSYTDYKNHKRMSKNPYFLNIYQDKYYSNIDEIEIEIPRKNLYNEKFCSKFITKIPILLFPTVIARMISLDHYDNLKEFITMNDIKNCECDYYLLVTYFCKKGDLEWILTRIDYKIKDYCKLVLLSAQYNHTEQFDYLLEQSHVGKQFIINFISYFIYHKQNVYLIQLLKKYKYDLKYQYITKNEIGIFCGIKTEIYKQKIDHLKYLLEVTNQQEILPYLCAVLNQS